MELKWTSKALSDLARLNDVLASVNQPVACAVQSVTKTPTGLLINSCISEQLFEFEPYEIQRALVGNYEMRYEIQESTNLWFLKVTRLIQN